MWPRATNSCCVKLQSETFGCYMDEGFLKPIVFHGDTLEVTNDDSASEIHYSIAYSKESRNEKLCYSNDK